jgi:hypothetical protein
MVKHHSNKSCFGYGDEPECWSGINPQSFSHAPRLQRLIEELQWRESLPGGESAKNNTDWFELLRSDMEFEAKNAGLVKGTPQWKLRWFFNCVTDLRANEKTKRCFAKPSSDEMGNKTTFFVCDITDGALLHADTISDYWAFASPLKGTGIHEYAAFLGEKPPCDNVGGCAGCIRNSTASLHSCSVRIDPETCSLEMVEHQ